MTRRSRGYNKEERENASLVLLFLFLFSWYQITNSLRAVMGHYCTKQGWEYTSGYAGGWWVCLGWWAGLG